MTVKGAIMMVVVKIITVLTVILMVMVIKLFMIVETRIATTVSAGLKLRGILFNLQKAGSKLVKEDITYILRKIRGEESSYPPMHRLQLKYSENEEYVCISSP